MQICYIWFSSRFGQGLKTYITYAIILVAAQFIFTNAKYQEL